MLKFLIIIKFTNLWIYTKYYIFWYLIFCLFVSSFLNSFCLKFLKQFFNSIFLEDWSIKYVKSVISQDSSENQFSLRFLRVNTIWSCIKKFQRQLPHASITRPSRDLSYEVGKRDDSKIVVSLSCVTHRGTCNTHAR